MPNAFRFPLQLRFSDIDSYAHVNNVAFLSYLETARVRLHESPSGISTNDGGQPSVRELAVGWSRSVSALRRRRTEALPVSSGDGYRALGPCARTVTLVTITA